jgi:hypothetical protein
MDQSTVKLKPSSKEIDRKLTNLLDSYGIGAVAEVVCICTGFSIRTIIYNLIMHNTSVDDKTCLLYRMQKLLEKKK